MPMPRRKRPVFFAGSPRFFQPIASAPSLMHSSSPQLPIVCSTPALPSPSAREDRRALAGWMWLLLPELERVDAELLGQLVHRHLHGEGGLGGAVAAVGAADRQVGVDRVPREADVRRAVERQHLAAAVADHGQRVRAVGAGVGDARRGRMRGERAVLLRRRCARGIRSGWRVRLRRTPPRACTSGSTGRPVAQRQHGRRRPRQHLLLGAEAAADARLDHPDLLHRDAAAPARRCGARGTAPGCEVRITRRPRASR